MPKPDYTTKRFMWKCVVVIKKYMTVDGSLGGLKFA